MASCASPDGREILNLALLVSFVEVFAHRPARCEVGVAIAEHKKFSALGCARRDGSVVEDSGSAAGEEGRSQEKKLSFDICDHASLTFARSGNGASSSDSPRVDCGRHV